MGGADGSTPRAGTITRSKHPKAVPDFCETRLIRIMVETRPMVAHVQLSLPKKCELNHIQPAQNAVDDCPKYRVVGGGGYRDSKG